MDTNNFKYIVGEAKSGGVATIRFFGKVTEESTTLFNNEFDFLENCICPSKIRVLINSEGGSVLYGMSTYSTIQNSKIPTECIIEGMAASMGSILWAAGEKSLMRDYSILMIHNPFLPDPEDKCDTDDKCKTQDKCKEPSDMVKAFTRQIETIYRKRFGLKAEHVRSIMTGEAGKDGTFFDAAAAVKAGIIPAENVLQTSKQLCEKVKTELSGIDDLSSIQSLMNRISCEYTATQTENKHFSKTQPTLLEIEQNQTNMNNEKTISAEYSAVTASLGMKENFEVKDVMARISELVAVEAKFKESNKALSDAQTVIAGKDATIGNLQKELDKATNALTTYQKREAQDKKSKIETMIEAAITAGKIDREAKTQWVEMAESNLALAESTLESIPARQQISKEIASDPDNVQAAADATKTAQDKIADKVNAVVGENFQFKTIEH